MAPIRVSHAEGQDELPTSCGADGVVGTGPYQGLTFVAAPSRGAVLLYKEPLPGKRSGRKQLLV